MESKTEKEKVKENNNLENKSNIKEKKPQKNTTKNNKIDNKLLKSYEMYLKEISIFNKKTSDNINKKIDKNILNKQKQKIEKVINNNKIQDLKEKKEKLILLKYEDYKAKLRQFNKSLNLTNREKSNENKNINKNINKSNSINNTRKNGLNKDFISVEKMFKKYNRKEWGEIYIKRFKSYQEHINKKREEIRKIKEKEKKKKEEEIISLSNKKRPNSSKKYRNIKSRYNDINQIRNSNYKIIEERFKIYKNAFNENLFNKRYFNEDKENIKNDNIIYFKGKIYDLDEERKTLISMSQMRHSSKSTENKNILNSQNPNKKNNISDSEKLIYEFFKNHLEK